MQKVSKQSLAMLALSILLAISIALTFTFAGLTNSKTAQGTITFDGNVAIVLGGTFAPGDVKDYKLTLAVSDNGEIDLSGATIGLAADSTAAYVKVTVAALTGDNATSGAVVMEADLTADGWTTLTGTTFTSEAKLSAGDSINLGDLISITVNLDKLNGTDSVTFDITVDAQAGAAYTA